MLSNGVIPIPPAIQRMGRLSFILWQMLRMVRKVLPGRQSEEMEVWTCNLPQLLLTSGFVKILGGRK